MSQSTRAFLESAFLRRAMLAGGGMFFTLSVVALVILVYHQWG